MLSLRARQGVAIPGIPAGFRAPRDCFVTLFLAMTSSGFAFTVEKPLKETAVQVQPYLSFEGRCEEAIEFYKKALGAKVEMLMRFKESPDPAMCPVGDGEKIMHSCLRIGDSQVMATDGQCQGKPSFAGISLTITAANDAEANRLFAAIADGGQVQMPLAKTFFASRFGMAADRFGVSWMVIAGAMGA
jgi:PhnB protein